MSKRWKGYEGGKRKRCSGPSSLKQRQNTQTRYTLRHKRYGCSLDLYHMEPFPKQKLHSSQEQRNACEDAISERCAKRCHKNPSSNLRYFAVQPFFLHGKQEISDYRNGANRVYNVCSVFPPIPRSQNGRKVDLIWSINIGFTVVDKIYPEPIPSKKQTLYLLTH